MCSSTPTLARRCAPLLAALLVAPVAVPPAARAEGTAALLRCVQARYGEFRDLSAGFVQESHVASLGRPRTSAGRLFFQPPGRMRWEYGPPEEQLVVADGRQLWFYRPQRRQVIVQPLDASLTRQTPLLFLLGKGDFAAEFTWEQDEPSPAAGGAVRITLRPRVEAPDLVRLVLEVVPGECRLAGTQIEDAYGNLTRLSFTGERANAGLDAGLFRFTPPAGTEVVRP